MECCIRRYLAWKLQTFNLKNALKFPSFYVMTSPIRTLILGIYFQQKKPEWTKKGEEKKEGEKEVEA